MCVRSESGGGGKCDNRCKGREVVVYVCGESLRRESARAYLSEAEQVAGYKPRPIVGHSHCTCHHFHAHLSTYVHMYVCIIEWFNVRAYVHACVHVLN